MTGILLQLDFILVALCRCRFWQVVNNKQKFIFLQNLVSQICPE